MNVYLKNKRYINFINEKNERIAFGTIVQSEPKNDNILNYYKIVYNMKEFKYRQIFIIIFIINLQLEKDNNNSYDNMLL